MRPALPGPPPAEEQPAQSEATARCQTHMNPIKDANPLTAVLSELHTSYDLLVDEVGGYVVLSGVVPGGEDLLSEEEPPGGVSLLGTLLLSVLFTLRDSVHHMVAAAAQRGHLARNKNVLAQQRCPALPQLDSWAGLSPYQKERCIRRNQNGP